MTAISKNELPLPEQTEGTEKNIIDTIELSDQDAARAFFTEARSRLLHVNNWAELCGHNSTKFQLTNEKGEDTEGEPQPGFYLKINIPGPGGAAGEGFDWVMVEEVFSKEDEGDDVEYFLFRVRPASDPRTPDENTAHFFSSKATSNFLILREGLTLTAAVLGRNEKANTKEDHNLLDKIRNFLVGTGAKLGMADPQWKSLVEGILSK